MSTPSQSSHITPSRAAELAMSNLLKIFSNRDPGSRMEAIKSTYAPEFTIYAPSQEILHGYEVLDKHVAELLAEREGWDFVTLAKGVKDGKPRGVRVNGDYVGIEWGFGPRVNGEVDVQISGSDVILVEKEGEVSGSEPRIKVLYVVLDGLADSQVAI
jgi:hypothetical protein